MDCKRQKLATDGDEYSDAVVALDQVMWEKTLGMSLEPDPFEDVQQSPVVFHTHIYGAQIRINQSTRFELRRAIRLTCKPFLCAYEAIHRCVHVSQIGASPHPSSATTTDCHRNDGRKTLRAPPIEELRETNATALVRATPNFLLTAPMCLFTQERASKLSLVLKTKANLKKLPDALRACAERAGNAPVLHSLSIDVVGDEIQTGDLHYGVLLLPFAHLEELELGIRCAVNVDMTWLEHQLPRLVRLTLYETDHVRHGSYDNDPRSYFRAAWPSTICSTRFEYLSLVRCETIPEFVFTEQYARRMKTLRVVSMGRAGLNLANDRLKVFVALQSLELRHMRFVCDDDGGLSINRVLPNLEHLALENVSDSYNPAISGRLLFFDAPCKKLKSLYINQAFGGAIYPEIIDGNFFPALESLCVTSCATLDLYGRRLDGLFGTIIDTRSMNTLRFLDMFKSYDHRNWMYGDLKPPIFSSSIEVLRIPIFKIANERTQYIMLAGLTRLFRLSIRHDHCARIHVEVPPRCSHIEWIEADETDCAENDAMANAAGRGADANVLAA